MSKHTTKKITCVECAGSGMVEVPYIEDTPTMYGKHQIGDDWSKIENVYIWFQAFNKKNGWRGIPGYVYETPTGEYLAPFRGDLVRVIKDTKDEFREVEL